jgi:hypothetical protein
MTIYRIAAFGFLLAFAGCSGRPDAPVVGAWHGHQPGPEGLISNSVDLVLKGAPDAPSGTYCVATVVHDPSARSFLGNHRWSGVWERSQQSIGGRSLTIIDLHNTLSSDISHYALMPDGTLRVLYPNGTLGTDAASEGYTLVPVSAGSQRGKV